MSDRDGVWSDLCAYQRGYLGQERLPGCTCWGCKDLRPDED